MQYHIVRFRTTSTSHDQEHLNWASHLWMSLPCFLQKINKHCCREPSFSKFDSPKKYGKDHKFNLWHKWEGISLKFYLLATVGSASISGILVISLDFLLTHSLLTFYINVHPFEIYSSRDGWKGSRLARTIFWFSDSLGCQVRWHATAAADGMVWGATREEAWIL